MMKRAILLVILAAGWAYGQPAGKTFEVASVKRAPPPDPTQGFRTGCFPGPGTYTCSNATVGLMAFQAYGLKLYQFPNANDDKDKFNVTAKVPPGTSQEEMLEMLRHLLAERFKLAFHYDKKEAKVFDLVVAKSGLKMKESGADPGATPPSPGPQKKDSEGFPIYNLPPGSISVGRANGLARITGTAIRMESLANNLVTLLHDPIFDATGLTGKYDFQYTCTQESIGQNAPNSEPATGPTIFAALEKDLGLKLEAKKGAIDMFVIDHVDKTAFGN
jgi:uncharacterized protein (TIGR03435 family)